MNWFARWQERFLQRRHPARAGSILLAYRQLYILPTRSCLALLLLCLLMLIGAINYQLSLAFFLTFLLAGVAHAALLRTYATLLGLNAQLIPAEPVFAGEMACFRLRLTSKKKRQRQGIMLITASGLPVPLKGDDLMLEGDFPVLTQQRGWLKAPRILLENRQPTGWFRCWSYLLFESKTLVYPRPEHQPPPLPGFGDAREGAGQALTGEDDFAGLRAYQAGDARRLIAWKQMARTDELMSRHFQSAAGAEIMLDWTCLPALDTEAKLARLCAWVLQAEQDGLRYALLLPERQIPADHGPAHCRDCLAALALHPGASI